MRFWLVLAAAVGAADGAAVTEFNVPGLVSCTSGTSAVKSAQLCRANS